jgi:hypothetical protein
MGRHCYRHFQRRRRTWAVILILMTAAIVSHVVSLVAIASPSRVRVRAVCLHQLRPALHALLRLYMRSHRCEYANALADSARAMPVASFSVELQCLLYGALESEFSRRKRVSRAHTTPFNRSESDENCTDNELENVLLLVSRYPERIQVLAKVRGRAWWWCVCWGYVWAHGVLLLTTEVQIECTYVCQWKRPGSAARTNTANETGCVLSMGNGVANGMEAKTALSQTSLEKSRSPKSYKKTLRQPRSRQGQVVPCLR